MPSFRYEASTMAGKIERGQLDADSPRAARTQLRARGLTAFQLTEVSARGASAGSPFAPRLSDSDLAWATRQMASLLAASLPLEASLTATIEQAEKKHIASALTAIRGDVRAGQRLADAMAARPRDFPDIYRALVSAGEDSGDLGRVMERLADYIEERNALRAKLTTAFIYPAIVMVISVCIVIFLLSYVVPQVVTAFTQARHQLPTLTVMMLAASDFVRDWGLLTGAVLAAGFAAWRFSLRSDGPRLAWHSRLMRMPVVGRFVLGANTARFASTLAILTDAGVPLLRALEAARQTLGNERLRLCVQDAIARVREGVSLGGALRVQKVFPPILTHLIASGEKTGNLSPMLDRAATTLSRDLERRAMAMTAMLEPLMILVMGAVVLMIVLAVLMPIMEMNQLVQ